MTQSDSESIRRAEWHLSMVAVYRAAADLMVEHGSPHSAGTLLYESAKQCLNAVANRRGRNPMHTRDKMRYLGDLVIQYPDSQPCSGRWMAGSHETSSPRGSGEPDR